MIDSFYCYISHCTVDEYSSTVVYCRSSELSLIRTSSHLVVLQNGSTNIVKRVIFPALIFLKLHEVDRFFRHDT